jgi:hypothetical protein
MLDARPRGHDGKDFSTFQLSTSEIISLRELRAFVVKNTQQK